MGKHIHEGWYTSSDEIPQPTSIIRGRNLRKPEPAAPDIRRPFGHDLRDIAKWIEDHEEDLK
jgi:hypothetical protein